MPQVPVYETPQALPSELPAVRQQTPYRMMQVADIGPEQVQGLGSAMMAAGRAYNDIQTREQIEKNEAAAKEHDANLMGGIQGILYGTPDQPDGYLHQKGKNAVDTRDDTVRRLQELATQNGESLTTAAQQQLVAGPTKMRIQAAIGQVMSHAAQQSDVYQQAAGKTRVAVAQNGAVLAYNPVTDKGASMGSEEFYGSMLSEDKMPSAYQQYLQTVKSETNDLLNRAGITDADLRDAAVKDALGKVYVGVLGQMLDGKNTQPGNIKLAQQYFDQVKDGLSAEQQDKIKTVLEAAGKKDESLSLFYEASKYAGNIAAQTGYVDDQYKAGKITSDVRDMAVQRLEHANAQRRAEQTENDKSVLGSVWDMSHQGKTLADVPAGTLAYIKTRGLGPQVDAIFKRASAGAAGEDFNDAQAYIDLIGMANNDQAGFMRMMQDEPTKVKAMVTDAHFEALTRVYAGIDKKDVRGMAVNKVMHDAVQDAKGAVLAANIKLSPKPGTADAQTLEQFQASLHDALEAAQPEWEAKKLGPAQVREQARQITMGILKDQALSGTGYFGTSFGQTHSPVWKMTPEQRAAKWEIPDGDRQQITAALQKQGMPVSEDNIQRAYKISQGVR